MNISRHIITLAKKLFLIIMLGKEWGDIEIEECTVCLVFDGINLLVPDSLLRRLKIMGGIFKDSLTSNLVTIMANASRCRIFFFNNC